MNHHRRRLTSALAPLMTAVAVGLWAPPAHAQEGPPLSIYGLARFDFIFDDSQMSHVDVPLWVESEVGGDTDSEISMHPRLSRVGLRLDPWRLKRKLEAAGTIEVDFQNALVGQTATSAPIGVMRLRHAYITLATKRVELLAGQTWDLAAPLFPSVNNDTLMWNAGNLGDRRPQIRLTFGAGNASRLAIAVGMPGAIDGQDLDSDGRLDGQASGVPVVQALFEYRKRDDDDSVRVGVWGHTGKQRLASDTEFRASAVGAYLLWPLEEELLLLGEFFYGQSLGDLRGGIGQSVNMVTGDEITSLGGWLELAVIPVPEIMFATGATVDRPKPGDLPDGARSVNWSIYSLLRLSPWRGVEFGLEYLHWRTHYKNAQNGTANRINLHLTYYF